MLLEAYVPVLIISLCLQLLITLCAIAFVTDNQYASLPAPIRFRLNGIFWPSYWYGDHGKKVDVHSRHLFKDAAFICKDVAYPLAYLLTFGLCSPPLAILTAVVGAFKCKAYVWALCLFGSRAYESEKHVNDMVQYPSFVSALNSISFPLSRVATRAFWIIIAYSSLFWTFFYWDTVAGVEWEAPVAVIAFVLLLMSVSYFLKRKDRTTNLKNVIDVEMFGVSSENPIIAVS